MKKLDRAIQIAINKNFDKEENFSYLPYPILEEMIWNELPLDKDHLQNWQVEYLENKIYDRVQDEF